MMNEGVVNLAKRMNDIISSEKLMIARGQTTSTGMTIVTIIVKVADNPHTFC